MKELKNIFEKYAHIKETNHISAALVTVVRVEGSSYRRTGARMLVCDDGTWVGGISGGCLEGDALKRAKVAILKKSPSLICYDTTKDDDHQIGVGLGCNGIIEVIFVPIDFLDFFNPVEQLIKISTSHEHKKVAITVCKTPESSVLWGRVISLKDEKVLYQLGEYLDVFSFITSIQSLEKSKNMVFKNGLQLFVELIPKPIHVFLMGHQYDLYPLISLIKELSWNINIVAEPSKVKSMERGACIANDDFDVDNLEENSAIILMSHSLETDKMNLLKIKNCKAKYIGMLGPKVRSERIINELLTAGHSIEPQFLDKIYAPVGLDLGAQTPEEIALSIVSEIKAVFSNRSGGSLRKRALPINDRDQAMFFN